MDLVAWNWADLLLGLWVLLFPGDRGAGPWDYVDQDGRSARLSVADGGTRDGKEYLQVTVTASGFTEGKGTFSLWVHRDGDQITVLEGVSLDAGNPVCHGAMPSLAPEATWMVSGKREFTVVRAGVPGPARAGRYEVADARPVVYRCGDEYVRAYVSDSAGICRLEHLEAPDGETRDVDAFVVRERAQLSRTAKPIGKAAVDLLSRAIDPGPKPPLKWIAGDRPLDPSVKRSDVEALASGTLSEDREDLLRPMELIRRAIHYLTAKDGLPLADGDAGLARVQGFIDRLEKQTLYRKVEKEGATWLSWFDLGWTVALAREAGLAYGNEGVTYLVQARRSFPEQPVIRVALSFAYEQAGLAEDASEQMVAAVDLSASGFPDRDRLLAALRAGRDDAAWRKAIDEARASMERLRPPQRVRVVLKGGEAIEGLLLDYGAAGYRVRVGREVRQIAEGRVDHVEFLDPK